MSWQYIAGFFDGEGNVSIPLGVSSLNVGIVQAGDTGLELLERIVSFLEEQGIRSRIDRSRKLEPNRKKVYKLYLSAKNAERFLRRVLPYIHIKKVVSQDVLRYRTLYPGMYTSPMCRAWRSETIRKNNALRTHCKRGHELTPENLYVYKRGERDSRSCKKCALELASRRYAKRCKVDAAVRRWL